jgi:hypothetical protein
MLREQCERVTRAADAEYICANIEIEKKIFLCGVVNVLARYFIEHLREEYVGNTLN